MSGEEFAKLYERGSIDESVIPFSDEVGFSLIRLYPEGTAYHADGMRMFIKVAVPATGFFYDVSMTKPEKRGEDLSYVITDGENYRHKVTNFFSGDGEFIFDKSEKKVIHSPSKQEFTLNEFVEILSRNHLRDLLFWKRKKNAVVNTFLQFLFWLSDKHYDRVKTAIDKYHLERNETYSDESQKNIDPFFKYFLISRNTLFGGLVIAFCSAVLFSEYKLISDFTVANPLIVLAFFLLLSFCEKISIWLDGKIKGFFTQRKFYNEQPNFIEKLHEYQFQNKFPLQLK